MRPITDEESRKLIIERGGQNFFVEASAGSGKTTSLVYRMVSLIENNEHPVTVDKICTITFTKAAADEFFSRFQALLSKRSVPGDDDTIEHLGPKTVNTMDRCQKALGNIDSCFLGTIDAFCNMIAHELPSELGIPSDSEVVETSEYISLVQKKHLEILRDAEHPLHSKALRFKELIRDDDDALAFGVKAFLEMRHTDIIFDSSLMNEDMDVYFAPEKVRLNEIVPKFIALRDCYKVGKNGEKCDRYKHQTSLKSNWRALQTTSWNDCLMNLHFALYHINKMDNFSIGVLGKGLDECFNIPAKPTASSSIRYCEDFKNEIKAIQTKLEEYKYALYCDYVKNISDLMSEEFKNAGKFQFYDFLYYLNNAFIKSATTNHELIDHILERHSTFLLDESQDTNPLQTELFFHLTGTNFDDDWKKIKPKEGTLFIVGDPKQSIYSFRDANVSAYLDNKEIFNKENEVLVLTKNFRSNVRLRDWFNHTMNDLLNHGSEALEHIDIPISAKERSEEKVPSDVIDGVYKYSLDTKDDGELIAKLIVSWVGKEKIYSKNEDRNESNKDKEPRKKERLVRYSDFMIVPRSIDAAKIINALLKYHIPITIAAKIPYTNSQTLMAIKDLVYLLKEPKTVEYFLSVIYGPLYRFDELDIILMKNKGFDLDISQPFEFEDERINNAIKELNYLYNETSKMSFSSTMLYLINSKELNICGKVSASLLEYTYFLIQKIKEGEEGKTITTVNELRNYIENFILGSDDQRTLRFKDKLDRVVISNVHKVKGLQAPIVILAKPATGIKKPTKYVDYSSGKPKTYISRFSTKDGFNDVDYALTERFADQQSIWEDSAKAEKERLEYVAATRAESVLIVGNIKVDKDEENPWVDLYNMVDDSYNNGNFVINDEQPKEVVPENISLGDYQINKDSYEQSFKYISPSQSRHSAPTNKDEIDEAEFDKGDEEREAATLKGTMVHKLMECIISSKNTYNVEELIKTILSDYGYSKEYDEMLHNISSMILNGGFEQVNSSLDKDILKTLLDAKKVWCEVPFSYQSKEGNIVSGIIDCMYLDKNDKYHVIDYKTNKENDVSELEKHYESQLKHYYYALKKMGIEADAHIYHIDLDK